MYYLLSGFRGLVFSLGGYLSVYLTIYLSKLLIYIYIYRDLYLYLYLYTTCTATTTMTTSTTTFQELGPQDQNQDRLSGPSSIMVVYIPVPSSEYGGPKST